LLRQAMADDGMGRPEIARALALVDSRGLVHELRTDLDESKRSFAMSAAFAAELGLELPGTPALQQVVEQFSPTVLVGTSGVPGMFTEAVVRAMAERCARPVVMPLSNPTANTEANPADVIAWSDGRALVATGSPFPPVTHDGVVHEIGQANNVFIFPGLGLGAIVAEATRISDEMILAAARALAAAVTADRLAAGALYPPVASLRAVSHAIARAVGHEAVNSGLGRSSPATLDTDVDAAMWWPAYVPYHRL
jgi:malic enzyme